MPIDPVVLLGAHDVGPMRYLRALDKYIQGRRLWVTSSLTESLIEEGCYEKCVNYTVQKPSILITGSGIVSSWDRDMVKWARGAGIPSVSIIDHWNCYRKRFEDNGRLVLPDHIVVNDEIAKAQAVEDGLPEDHIFIGGNPWLEELLHAPLDQSQTKSWRRRNALPEGRLLVFIAESLRSSFPTCASEYPGYDEYEVLRAVIDATPANVAVVIKRHPEEQKNKYDSFLRKNKVFSVNSATLGELASESYLIIGMTSMLLLELAIFRADILSYTPNASRPFIGNLVGATIPVLTEADLIKKIGGNNSSDVRCNRPKPFYKKFVDSGKRISEFLATLIRQ